MRMGTHPNERSRLKNTPPHPVPHGTVPDRPTDRRRVGTISRALTSPFVARVRAVTLSYRRERGASARARGDRARERDATREGGTTRAREGRALFALGWDANE